MEKVGKVAQKKNLEGNSQNPNSFSVLSVDEVIHISSEMGVVIEDDDFATYNLLKDLEIARNDLYQKQSEQKLGPQTESVEVIPEGNNIHELEWLHEESSESEDFILVESRKKRNENKRSVKISPNKRGRNQDQAILSLRSNRGRKPSNAFSSKCTKQKKKS
jgi:tetraacyldisaccharide-1-P 4'-kinase